jgi:hypothetical protein
VATVKRPRSWPNSSESACSGGGCAAVDPQEGRGRAGRAAADGTRHSLLARPGRTEDQRRGVRSRHEVNVAHQGAQPGTLADQGIADVLTAEARE